MGPLEGTVCVGGVCVCVCVCVECVCVGGVCGVCVGERPTAGLSS